MRDFAIHQLAEILRDNLGQRLTPALATGIANTLDHILREAEPKPAEQTEAPAA